MIFAIFDDWMTQIYNTDPDMMSIDKMQRKKSKKVQKTMYGYTFHHVQMPASKASAVWPCATV